MKRFYKTVSVVKRPGGYGVALDGKPVRTPAGKTVVLPTEGAARRVASDWSRQGETIVPASMAAMQIAATAIDRVAILREAAIEGIAAYGGSDVVCYRAEEPEELVNRQRLVWQPLLDWMAREHGVALAVGMGVMPVRQDPAALRRLRGLIARFSDFGLAALGGAVAQSGSLVIALALAEGRLDPEAAFRAAFLDELYQADLWGEDAEARARRQGARREIDELSLFINSLGSYVRRPGD